MSNDDEQFDFDLSQVEKFPELSVKQNQFIAVFRVTGDASIAAKVAGCTRNTHGFWLRTCPKYREAYETCYQTIAAMIHDSLVHRLIHGWDEPVFFKDEHIGDKRKFDNTNAMKYLAKIKPETFGEKIEIDTTIKPVSPEVMLAALAGTVPMVEEDDLPNDHADDDRSGDSEAAV